MNERESFITIPVSKMQKNISKHKRKIRRYKENVTKKFGETIKNIKQKYFP